MAMTRERRPPGAVLLDKDGTLLENVPYNVDPARTPHHVVDRLDLAADIVVREAVRRHGSWVLR